MWLDDINVILNVSLTCHLDIFTEMSSQISVWCSKRISWKRYRRKHLIFGCLFIFRVLYCSHCSYYLKSYKILAYFERLLNVSAEILLPNCQDRNVLL